MPLPINELESVRARLAADSELDTRKSGNCCSLTATLFMRLACSAQSGASEWTRKCRDARSKGVLMKPTGIAGCVEL